MYNSFNFSVFEMVHNKTLGGWNLSLSLLIHPSRRAGSEALTCRQTLALGKRPWSGAGKGAVSFRVPVRCRKSHFLSSSTIRSPPPGRLALYSFRVWLVYVPIAPGWRSRDHLKFVSPQISFIFTLIIDCEVIWDTTQQCDLFSPRIKRFDRNDI